MLVAGSLSSGVRFIVDYLCITPKVNQFVHLGTTHESTRAYTYHIDIETSILAAYHKSNNVNR